MKIKPWGMQGGSEGRGSKYYKKLNDGSTVILPSKFQGIQLKPGERIVIETAGGGGWGPPEERSPESVLKDVTNGFISIEKARVVYNVSIDEKKSIIKKLED